MKRTDDTRFPVVLAECDALAHRFAFEQSAHARQVFEVGERHRRHTESALALRHDEGIGHQQCQRLAQRPRADLIGRLQMFDAQLLSGLVAPIDDVPAQLAIRRLDQRSRLICGFMGFQDISVGE